MLNEVDVYILTVCHAIGSFLIWICWLSLGAALSWALVFSMFLLIKIGIDYHRLSKSWTLSISLRIVSSLTISLWLSNIQQLFVHGDSTNAHYIAYAFLYNLAQFKNIILLVIIVHQIYGILDSPAMPDTGRQWLFLDLWFVNYKSRKLLNNIEMSILTVAVESINLLLHCLFFHPFIRYLIN